ncbi:histidine phosphatase family protein [Xinfangfangia sp. D13-10-4-6]|uniref:histidine phosphatase family protein n=1 Tax=Pseudogemmobacter hezensis TaxID=2737662 RepID=UPI001556C862|nr:histidine phosphatase family protein [Pseudogemmobacter hezensis]NPD14182.1 histidine phosphatase family protein [Pseudogemmobacter hezensis]
MTRFWLVRHGPTHANSMVGWSDIPADLSDHAQIARLNAALPDVPVISSDLCRAVATADCLRPRPRLPHDPDLREIHFGEWELKTWAEAQETHPEAIRAFWEAPGPAMAPGGECWDQLTDRVNAALLRLTGTADELIIVAHFGAILAAVQLAAGLSVTEAMTHKIDNLSVTCIDFSGSQPGKLHKINQIP